MRLIGITGRAGTGKDTAADHLCRRRGFAKYSLAQPIKNALNAIFGWNPVLWDDRAWKEAPLPAIGKSPRQLAQTLGTEWGREIINRDLWLVVAEQRIYNARLGGDSIRGIVIPDIRFEDEADWLRRQGGDLIHLRRAAAPGVAAHSSEQGVTPVAGDRVIYNDGTVTDLCLAIDEALS